MLRRLPRLLLPAVFALLPVVVTAHRSPTTRVAHASNDPARPSLDCQSHWFDDAQGGQAQHAHMQGVDVPIYQSITGPFDLHMRVRLFQTNAVPFDLSVEGPGRFPSEVSRTPLVVTPTGPFVGNPTGLVTGDFVTTQDPTLWHPAAKHGGAPVGFTFQSRTSDGAEIRSALTLPFRAELDSTLPLNPEWPLECWAWSHSSRTAAEIGSLVITFAVGDRQAPTSISHWPTTPINTLTLVRFQMGRYGPPDVAQYLTGECYLEQRNNPDLHAGVEGALIQRIERDCTNNANTYMDLILDPAELHDGVNTILIRGSVVIPQAGPFPGGEKAQVLLTGTVVKGEGGPEPVDTDGDGIFDPNDDCPGTPPGTVVDSHGCPIPPPPATWDSAPFRAAMTSALTLAQDAPEPLKSQLSAAILAVLALIGG